MATRVSELSKKIGVSNKTLILFFAEKHPELNITDPSKHHGKSFSWFPADGHTMEDEIQAELDAFFVEHPELAETPKGASKKPAAKAKTASDVKEEAEEAVSAEEAEEAAEGGCGQVPRLQEVHEDGLPEHQLQGGQSPDRQHAVRGLRRMQPAVRIRRDRGE